MDIENRPIDEAIIIDESSSSSSKSYKNGSYNLAVGEGILYLNYVYWNTFYVNVINFKFFYLCYF